MKLSVSTLACPAWGLDQVVSAAAASRLDGIDFRGLGAEIDITRLPAFNDDLPATLALLQANNLQVPCLNTSVTLVTPASERWEMMLDEARRYAALAERTHTRFIRIFGGGLPKGMSYPEALALAARHLRQIIKVTRNFGVRTLIETHDDWSASPRMAELVGEFSPDECGVVYDVEHPFRKGRETPAETVERLGRYLAHTHIKDSVYDQDKYVPKLLGQGELPLREFITALKQTGYDGWICLETEKRWHANAPEPEESIPQFAQAVQSLLGAPVGT